MDIVVIPKGELGDDYKKKNEQLDSLREECTSLLFTDALNGDGSKFRANCAADFGLQNASG